MSSKSESDITNSHPPSSRRDIDSARGSAITQYAHLESQLCHIFSLGFDTHEKGHVHHNRATHAAFVFYKILNSRSRNEILAEVLKEKAHSCSQNFRKSLIKELEKIDSIRNKLAHWEVNISMGSDGKERHFLVPPRHGITDGCYSPREILDWKMRMQFSFYLFAIVGYSILDTFPDWLSKERGAVILTERVTYPPTADHALIGIWHGPILPPH